MFFFLGGNSLKMLPSFVFGAAGISHAQFLIMECWSWEMMFGFENWFRLMVIRVLPLGR